MRVAHLLFIAALGVCSQENPNLLKVSLSCDAQNCNLDLLFKQEKANPTISQKISAPSKLVVSIGRVSSSLNCQKKLESSQFRSFNLVQANDRFDLEFGLGDKISKGFDKISRLDSKTVRFSMKNTDSKSLFQTELCSSDEKTSVVKSKATPPAAKTTDKPKVLGKTADAVLFKKFAEENLSTVTKVQTSTSFPLSMQIRPMVFLTRSSIYESSDLKSRVIGEGDFGKLVERIQIKSEWVQVRAKSGLVGYVLRNKLVYEDELTPAQSEQIGRNFAKQPQARYDLAIKIDAEKSGLAVDPSKKVFANTDSAQTILNEDAGQKHFSYSSFGRRDPFVPVKLPEVEGISIDDVHLVGIIWSAKDPIAIFEDAKVPERSYSLRQGDAVMNGMVQKITQEGVVFSLTEFGVTRQFSMTLPKEQK